MGRIYDTVAVLIPCYNEAKTIGNVIDDFKKHLLNCNVYVYDNNSADGTDKIAREHGAIVHYEQKQGKGNVIRKMFREIQADCYILVDGDNTYSAEYAPEMVENVLQNNCDMVIGDRLSTTYFKENKRLFHNFGNSFVRFGINHIFDGEIKDVMTGYRAFSNLFVKSFAVLSKGFEIETEMTIHALDKNMTVKNVPVNYKDRPEGSHSKLNTCSDGIKVIKTIVKMSAVYKPFFFWTFISLIQILFSLFLVVPAFTDCFYVGTPVRFPSLIISCFIMLSAIIAFFLGIILQTLRYKEKQAFEYQLIQTYKEYNYDKDKK